MTIALALLSLSLVMFTASIHALHVALDTKKLLEANRCSSKRAEIESSEVCGCYFCLDTFPPSDIQEWVDVNETTALCPRCDIDSVIGSNSGFPVTDAVFLEQMRKYFFGDEVFTGSD